jgi:hypothetical protein
MQIGKKLIGSIPLDQSRIADTAYINKKIIELENKFSFELQQSNISLNFYIDTVPSKMNAGTNDGQK